MAGTWTKITATVSTENLDRAAAIVSMIDTGLMIEDFSDFSLNGMYGELVDERILESDKTLAKISVFAPEEKNPAEYTAFIEARLSAEGIPYTLEISGMDEEDWADSWKKYFKPIHFGKLTVVPSWEDYSPRADEVIVKIDPGMAFGTGTHETTGLVMKILSDEIRGGERLLDVGCGSGILAIAAAKLGASEINAYDIDPIAVKVARDNAAVSGLDNINVDVSDLLLGVRPVPGGYNVCTANIVADIILRMLPDIGPLLAPNAKIILSGIVSERAEDIISAAESLGYSLIRRETENDWVALMIGR